MARTSSKPQRPVQPPGRARLIVALRIDGVRA